MTAAASAPPASEGLEPLPSPPGRVVVVGAGITGLAAAHRLHRLAPEVDVVVLEAAADVGGKVRTSAFDGLVVDEAADAFLARVPEAVGLCRELGLDDELVTPDERSALLWRHGALRPLPAGLVLGVPTDLDALARSGLIGEAGVARAGEDLTLPADGPGPGRDESVGALVRRRLGDEVFEVLVAPLLGGVNAGDADELSVAAGAPQLAAAVADQPSLIEGLRRQRRGADPDAPLFYGLASGTATLLRALGAALPAGSVRTGVAVTELRAAPRGVVLDTTAGELTADAVVLACPAPATARLVGDVAPSAAEGLSSMPWASVVMATLAVDEDRLGRPLDASGYLVPAAERRFLTACSFGSTKWRRWHRPGRALLRASAGHAGDGGEAVGLPDDEVVARLGDDLADHVGLDGRPDAVRLSRWPDALPQYAPGHLDRARGWQRRVWEALPGVWATGASFEGLGLPACIRQGEQAARWLLSPGAAPADSSDPPRRAP